MLKISVTRVQILIGNLMATNHIKLFVNFGKANRMVTFSKQKLRKREAVIGVLLFCDYKSDESYTPSKIDILCGNDPNDLRWIFKLSDRPIDPIGSRSFR